MDIVIKLSNAKKLYRAHNIEHHIWFDQSNHNKNIFKKWYLKIQSERLKNEEIKFWNNIDSILSLSENDRSYILKHCPTSTYTIGLHPEKRHLEANNQSTKVDFFHIGAMDWLPNRDGIDWISVSYTHLTLPTILRV